MRDNSSSLTFFISFSSFSIDFGSSSSEFWQKYDVRFVAWVNKVDHMADYFQSLVHISRVGRITT